MPRVHVTGGYLNVEGFDPEGPVDPGFGVGGGDRPGNALPPGVPPMGGTLPEPPPGVWPPPSFGSPIVPIIDNTLPVAPGTIWPSPGRPNRPDAGLPVAPGHPGGGPMPGGERPGNALPGLPPGKFWVVAGIPGVGWRYVCVDPSLSVGMPLPVPPVTPGTPLPPTPAPKT